jgi:hypothetical protein
MKLTDRQLAFVAAMEENGLSEEATIAFMTLDETEFDKSKYWEFYTLLADCQIAFNYGIARERARCLSICERLGDEGMDGHYCADEIVKDETK